MAATSRRAPVNPCRERAIPRPACVSPRLDAFSASFLSVSPAQSGVCRMSGAVSRAFSPAQRVPSSARRAYFTISRGLSHRQPRLFCRQSTPNRGHSPLHPALTASPPLSADVPDALAALLPATSWALPPASGASPPPPPPAPAVSRRAHPRVKPLRRTHRPPALVLPRLRLRRSRLGRLPTLPSRALAVTTGISSCCGPWLSLSRPWSLLIKQPYRASYP